MAGQLIPVTDIEAPGEFGERIQDLAEANELFLTRERFLPGVVTRWVGLDSCQVGDRVAHLQERHAADGPFQAFAVVDDYDTVQGMATMQGSDEVRLHQLRAPLPPRGLAKLGRIGGLGVVEYSFAETNLSAWVDVTQMYSVLADAYAGLVTLHDQRNHDTGTRRRAWTIEPVRAPVTVHSAIAASGLTRIDRGRYDDQEARRRQIPPRAVLYAQVSDAHDADVKSQKEGLRTSQSGRDQRRLDREWQADYEARRRPGPDK